MRLRTAFLAGMLAGIAIVANTVSANEISKWIDGNGSVHYGDQPPYSVDATRLQVRPNVIDTGVHETPTIRSQLGRSKQLRPHLLRPHRSVVLRQGAQPDAKVPPERADLRAYVEHCRRNRGVDCEWEARAMIDGPATVLFPGDPYIFRRPDVKPAPPGLPLKFHIKP